VQVSNHQRPGGHTPPGRTLALALGGLGAITGGAAWLSAELGAVNVPVPIAVAVPGSAGLLAVGYIVGRLVSGPPAAPARASAAPRRRAIAAEVIRFGPPHVLTRRAASDQVIGLPTVPGQGIARVCMHADQNGEGSHILAPGEPCPAAAADSAP